MLTLHHVTKTYGKGHLRVDALRDVELQVDTGEFVAVIGPSGSGKSTLMNILGCLDDPTQGEYLLDGVPVGVYLLGFQEADPEIEGIGLCKDFRGRGLGRELLLSLMALLAEEGYKRTWLSVSTSNIQAYPLYQSAGFVQTRLLSHWYQVISEGDLLA